MPATSPPASSTAEASSGPTSSGTSRLDTSEETIRIAARTAGRVFARRASGRRGRCVSGLGVADKLADAGLVPRAQQLDRVRVAVDDLLEERLAVLVGRERALRPAAHLVEEDRQAGIGLAVLGGDLRLHALGERR